MNMDENDLEAVAGNIPRKFRKIARVYRSAGEAGRIRNVRNVFGMNTDLLFRRVAIRIAEAQCKHASAGYITCLPGNHPRPVAHWVPVP